MPAQTAQAELAYVFIVPQHQVHVIRIVTVQVAALAGVPETVIRRARRYLAHLEQTQDSTAGPQQSLDLFSVIDEEPPATHPAIERLDATDPDELSPRAALELIYELKRLARSDD